MKTFLTLIMVLITTSAAYGGIITNGANDSLSFDFCIWDSTGNNTLALASGDSVFLTIWYPNGQYCYKDSTDFNDTEIVGITQSTFTTYVWRDDVTDIDGTPVYGASYRWEIIVKDQTGAATETRSRGEFTLLPNFIDDYDGTGYAGGTINRNVDVTKVSTSTDAANNFETFFDNTGSQFTNFDDMYDNTGYAGGTTRLITSANITAISDDAAAAESLEVALDGGIPTLSEQLAVLVDSLQAVLDSLRNIEFTIWDEVLTGATHNVQNSAGKRLRAVASDVISAGTGRGAPDGITFLLASAESESDDFYNGHILKIITGTGISQERTIEDYTGATDSVTLHTGDDWTTNPANNDEYEIIGGHAVEVNHIHDDVINNDALADDLNFDSLSLRTLTINNTTTTNPAFSVRNSGGGTAVHFHSSSGNGQSGLHLQGSGTAGRALLLDGLAEDMTGSFNAGNLDANTIGASEIAADAIGASELATDAVTEITDATWDKDTTDAFAVAASIGKFIKDSTQGAAGSLDSITVYGAVEQLVADSFGVVTNLISDISDIKGFIDTEVQAILDTLDNHDDWVAQEASISGSGPRLCSLFVADGSGNAMTSGNTSITSGATRYTPSINGDGFIVLSLTDATWTALVYVPGFVQDTIPQTFVVTASFKDTITVTAQTVTGATNPALVKVYAWTDRLLGDTLPGAEMTFSPQLSGRERWTAANDRVILPRQESATADDSGYVFIELYPTETTNNENGDSLFYDVTINMRGYTPWIYDNFIVYDDSTGNTQMVK